MHKEYAGKSLETRCNLAHFEIYSTVDKSGRVRWYRHLKGYGTRRVDEHYAKRKLREFGLTLEDKLKHDREFESIRNRFRK